GKSSSTPSMAVTALAHRAYATYCIFSLSSAPHAANNFMRSKADNRLISMARPVASVTITFSLVVVMVDPPNVDVLRLCRHERREIIGLKDDRRRLDALARER